MKHIDFTNLPRFDSYIGYQERINDHSGGGAPGNADNAHSVENASVEQVHNMPVLRTEDDVRMDRLQCTINRAMLLGQKYVIDQGVLDKATNRAVKAGVTYSQLREKMEAAWKEKKGVDTADGTHFEKIALAFMTSDEMAVRLGEKDNPFADETLPLSEEEVQLLIDEGMTLEQLIADGKMDEAHIYYVVNSNIYDFDTPEDMVNVGQKAVQKCCDDLQSAGIDDSCRALLNEMDKAIAQKKATLDDAIAYLPNISSVQRNLLKNILEHGGFIPLTPEQFWTEHPNVEKHDTAGVKQQLDSMDKALREMLRKVFALDANDVNESAEAKSKRDVIDEHFIEYVVSLAKTSHKRVELESAAHSMMKSREFLTGDLKCALAELDTTSAKPIENVAKLHSGVQNAMEKIKHLDVNGREWQDMVAKMNSFNAMFKECSALYAPKLHFSQPPNDKDYKKLLSNSVAVSLQHLKMQFEAVTAMSIQQKVIAQERKTAEEIWSKGGKTSCEIEVELGVEFGILGFIKAGVTFTAKFAVQLQCETPYGYLQASFDRDYSLSFKAGVEQEELDVKVWEAALAGGLKRSHIKQYANSDEFLQEASNEFVTCLLTHQTGSHRTMKKSRSQIELAKLNNYNFVQNMRERNVFGANDEVRTRSLNKRLVTDISTTGIGGSVSAATDLLAPGVLDSSQVSFSYEHTTSTTKGYKSLFTEMLDKCKGRNFNDVFDEHRNNLRFCYPDADNPNKAHLRLYDDLRHYNSKINDLKARIAANAGKPEAEQYKNELTQQQEQLRIALTTLYKEYNSFCYKTWEKDAKRRPEEKSYLVGTEEESLKLREAQSRVQYIRSLSLSAAALLHLYGQTVQEGQAAPKDLQVFRDCFTQEFSNPQCKLKADDMKKHLFIVEKEKESSHELTLGVDFTFKAPVVKTIATAGVGPFNDDIELTRGEDDAIGVSGSVTFGIPSEPTDDTIYGSRKTLDLNVTLTNVVSAEVVADIVYQALRNSSEVAKMDLTIEAMKEISQDIVAETMAVGVNSIDRARLGKDATKGFVFNLIHNNSVSFNLGVMFTKFGPRVAKMSFEQEKANGFKIGGFGGVGAVTINGGVSVTRVSNRKLFHKFGTNTFAGLLDGMKDYGVEGETWRNYALAHANDFGNMLVDMTKLESKLNREYVDYMERMANVLADRNISQETRERVRTMTKALSDIFVEIKNGNRLNPQQANDTMTKLVGFFLEFDALAAA